MEDLVGTDGSRGLRVPPGDPGAAGALASLLTDPRRAQALGAAARAWLEQSRTTAYMAADIRAVLDRTAPGSFSARSGTGVPPHW